MKKYFISLFILIILFLIQLFVVAGMTVKLPYLDIPMHIVAGIALALFVSAFLESTRIGENKKKLIVFIVCLIAGLAWEGFEIYFNIARYPLWTTLYYIDTAKDLINDVLGSAIVILLIK